MSQKNRSFLIGNLANDPYFEFLKGGQTGKTPYLRFDLVVERDTSQGPQAHHTDSPQNGAGKERRADLIRVTMYGASAWINYFYLKKGADVSVSGWVESRLYFDRRMKRMRRVMEINAQEIFFGRGCDFARGDHQRKQIISQLESEGLCLTAELKGESVPMAIGEAIEVG